MSGYGLEIVQTLIVDIEPDQHVKKSMNEINAGIYSDIGNKILYKIINTDYHYIYNNSC